jgi:shikimate dehydrogenase
MEEKENQYNKKLFGLLGKDISYSFSKGYFTEKFRNENLDNHNYINLDLPAIEDFPLILEQYKSDLSGINVTIPYKEVVISFLDEIDEDARRIGAVNTITISPKGRLKGFNTDVYGFEHSLKPLLEDHHKKALILGTGGASKAVAFALHKLNIEFFFVSRNPQKKNEISYNQLTEELFSEYSILINCSPVGTFPNVEKSPKIPYEFLSKKHLLFDLIYNPAVTTFLSNGKKQGAVIKNGLQMLELQAEKSWAIWNS